MLFWRAETFPRLGMLQMYVFVFLQTVTGRQKGWNFPELMLANGISLVFVGIVCDTSSMGRLAQWLAQLVYTQ